MAFKILSEINSPNELRELAESVLPDLAVELRQFIIDVVSVKEGHLGASLGVMELTIALHYVFNTPVDKLVWDVGHQAYGHKILTGRRAVFETNRRKNGLSGFPKREESEYDTFGVGHSSTSISAALGMALAAQIKGDFERQHIAVIGDASIAAGMAFEGLNHAGVTSANLLVILNDNAIGIDPSVGALKDYLTAVKTGRNHRDNNMIKSLNFDYSGPIDGHDLPALIAELRRLKDIQGPRFLHLITTKGKGLKQAEEDQVRYHAPGKFDSLTGELIVADDSKLPTKYQDVFGLTLVELAQQNPKIIGITPAMPTGSSMKYMMEAFPDRAFDVGIAEQHAVTLAAGMATEGLLPFCAIYSTFLQRAYDQVIHDVALQCLPVIFCLDRAGLVGEDGATHQGVYDIAYLNCIPNLIIAAPLNELELRNLLYTAQLGLGKPIAIRYPRGRGVLTNWKKPFEKINIENIHKLRKGHKFAILSTGTIGNNVIKAFEASTTALGAHYHFPIIKPLNEKELHRIAQTYSHIYTIEEAAKEGGFGSKIAAFAAEFYPEVSVKILGIPDTFIEQASVLEQEEECGIDVSSVLNIINTWK
ncbi:1-deoxy-D-xylulose-5-phosphate synthase [Flavobacterium sp. NKUCC04_CG]|uniref:1-deoxy-D-xylulose-5-phosphate synthase n=1 Tax=Flavobacterium sp. NKUCC04_CG TaxID=2842121 RepID=UPI001C5BC5E7|nr:1-deoxy-D-xylulose-5-phosphate synthase [Flavobacterium sp. NKUCC04_CG]MBW3518265.1 1-deoxy-D-xylulose-5-phosphate synthase [Flavobacterium sp. NKUCC04_CG]